jgi:hypothetical protein
VIIIWDEYTPLLKFFKNKILTEAILFYIITLAHRQNFYRVSRYKKTKVGWFFILFLFIALGYMDYIAFIISFA